MASKITNISTVCSTNGSGQYKRKPQRSASLFLVIGFHRWQVDSWYHDEVIKWKHLPRYWPFVRGIHGSPVSSPHKGQWRRALMFPLICALNKWLSKQSWAWWFETPSPSLWSQEQNLPLLWKHFINHDEHSIVSVNRVLINTNLLIINYLKSDDPFAEFCFQWNKT